MRRQFGSRSLHLFALMIVVGVINLNTLGNPFVLDDRVIIQGNSHFKNSTYLSEYFSKGFCEGVAKKCSYYRPLVAISYLVDFGVWGENPHGFHLTNLIIHLAVVLLFYSLTAMLFGRRVALVAAFFFAVHPIHTESVAWLSARTDPVAALFLLISFGCFYGYLVAGGPLGNKGWRGYGYYFLSVGFFGLALLAKESAVVLPLLLLTYEFLFHYDGRAHTPRMVSHYLPLVGITLIYFVVRGVALGYPVVEDNMWEGLWRGWPAIPLLVWDYFRLELFPYPLYIFRPAPNMESALNGPVIWGWLFLGGYVACLLRFRQVFKGAVFGGLWFLISLTPVLFIVTVSRLEAAERFSYIPSMGFALMVGFVAGRAFTGWGTGAGYWVRRGLQTLSVGVLLILGVMTILRNQDWRDEVVLWEGHHARVPDSPVGHGNLGNLYLDRGDLELALQEYQKQLHYRPKAADVLHHLGLVYHRMGQQDKALEGYNRALAAGGVNPLTFYNMGLIYKERGQTENAARLFQMSITLDPDYYWSHLALAEALESLGEWEPSIDQFKAVLRIQPNDEGSHFRLAQLYERVGKTLDAKRHYELFLQTAKRGMITDIMARESRRRLEMIDNGKRETGSAGPSAGAGENQGSHQALPGAAVGPGGLPAGQAGMGGTTAPQGPR